MLIALAASCALAAGNASASPVFTENWENGGQGWTPADTSGTPDQSNPTWQVLDHPERISVNPGINPALVTLPDPGSLPAANDGTHAAWYGDTSSGTFCGADWASVAENLGASKNGCTSREPFSGTLTSPTFSLAGQASAVLHFGSWFEIEGVEATGFDLMQIQYSTDNGATWSNPVQLNPAQNPSGASDTTYSNNGPETSPSWQQSVVDLTPAAGSSQVKVRFTFNTGDTQFNGFRGWLIDSISVQAPSDALTPSISSVDTCSGTQDAPVTVIHGSNFIEGSTVTVDGAPDPASSTLSSSRIEITALSPGTHALQVQSPDGSASNTVSVAAGTCASPPANLTPPTISGSTVSGHTLTETNGSWTNNPASLSYQWQDCNSSGTGCSAIAGATGQTYTLRASDVAHTIRVEEFDTTAAGTAGPATSSPTAVVTGSATVPSVSSSPPVVHGSGGAAFSGVVDPEGLLTNAHFKYGLDPKYSGGGPVVYDRTTPTQLVGSDFVDHVVSASVTGLVPNALYHVRLVASSSAGTVDGPDRTFITAKDPAPPPPVTGKTMNVLPVSGLVFIRAPRGKTLHALHQALGGLVKGQGFVPLTEARQIPTGSQVDARQGTLKLITATAKRGKTQSGVFSTGLFKLTQQRHGLSKGLTTLSLLEAAFHGAPSYATCKAHGAADSAGSPSAQAARLSSRVLNTLHARDQGGRFRTRGRYSAGTVRGTQWDTIDRCDGTLTVVHRGSVAVRDFKRRRTIIVHAHHSYLAKALIARKH